MAEPRVLLGDCRKLLPIACDVIITDPPYAVDKAGDMLGQISANYHEKGTHTRGYADHDPAQFALLLEPAFDGMLRSLPRGGTMVAFCGNRTFSQMVTIAERAGFEMLDVIVFLGGGSFAKSRSMLMPRHEMAMYMRRPGGVRQINPVRNISNVWDIPKGKAESEHPTTKPQSWMRRTVEVFSEPGDLVLDPFCGSGSTGVACAALGRDFIGIEKDADHVALAEGRIEPGHEFQLEVPA